MGASLTGEVSPRLWAKALAMGELLLTRLGATYLANKNLPAQWLDARDFLYVDSKNENKNNNNDNNQRRH